MNESGVLRIGELSRRSGVSPELLRAWERRYDLLRPTRSSGGLRLYTTEDAERVRLMQQHLAEGLAAAEAAALARQAGTAPDVASYAPEQARKDLGSALEAFDEGSAQALFDSLLAAATLDSVLSGVVLPYLRDLGERWAAGEVSVAQEHFASNVIRGRLLGLARGWGRGFGPLAILACAPGELHDLGLISFGLALRQRGWRIAYLGVDTPADSLVDAARSVSPELVVVTAVAGERFNGLERGLKDLATGTRVAVGGAGATEVDAEAFSAVALSGDPVAEADRVSA